MDIRRPLLEGTFLVRENRFRARVLLGDREVAVHVPNSGRLTELLSPGRSVFLAEAGSEKRLTAYDLLMVPLPHTLVSVDARLPNHLFREALEAGGVAEFEGYSVVRQEIPYGHSRLDFLLDIDGHQRLCLVEVKSVTLVRDGVGLFPDAVTARGARHVEELRRASRDGKRAAVVFVIQRSDARAFAPHDESDPHFGQVLREAVADEVEVYAHICRVRRRQVVLADRVPVWLTEDG